MQILRDKKTKEVVYANDNYELTGETTTIVKDESGNIKFYIGDCGTNNVEIIETSMTLPVDYSGHKYVFNNDVFSLNPAYVEPSAPQE